MRRIEWADKSGLIALEMVGYPPNISNPVNTNYMFIEKLNQYTEEQIIGLKHEDNKLRLLIEEQPDIEKLKLLKEAIINETTEVTLVMRSNNNNLIAFSYFECRY